PAQCALAFRPLVRHSDATSQVAAHRVLATAHLACDLFDPQPRSLQPQHLRHVLRRLHHWPPRRIDNGESLHDSYHVKCPSVFGGSFPGVAYGVNLSCRLTLTVASPLATHGDTKENHDGRDAFADKPEDVTQTPKGGRGA